MDERLKLVNINNPYRIGNWVTDIFGHRMQVTRARGNYVTGRYVDDEGRIHEAEGHVDAAIGVIEIDKDVLTAMGFEQTPYGTWFLFLDKKGEIRYDGDDKVQAMLSGAIPHVGYNEESETLRIKTREGADMFIPCHYVYELQNALFLARIDFPIEI